VGYHRVRYWRKMRIFVCSNELGLGFVVAQRLIAQGHRIVMFTSFDDLIPNLRKNGMNPVLGDIEDAEPQRQLARADAVIDTELPLTWPLKRESTSPASDRRC
jgi:nucleoside-diphosphate-sugar epimerase